MRISDWSSDVCSSDLHLPDPAPHALHLAPVELGIEVAGALDAARPGEATRRGPQADGHRTDLVVEQALVELLPARRVLELVGLHVCGGHPRSSGRSTRRRPRLTTSTKRPLVVRW